jgi:hypothetical protein
MTSDVGCCDTTVYDPDFEKVITNVDFHNALLRFILNFVKINTYILIPSLNFCNKGINNSGKSKISIVY